MDECETEARAFGARGEERLGDTSFETRRNAGTSVADAEKNVTGVERDRDIDHASVRLCLKGVRHQIA
jgi:hypothetical protein